MTGSVPKGCGRDGSGLPEPYSCSSRARVSVTK